MSIIRTLQALKASIPTNERTVILVSKRAKMTPGKMAAQVAHAALAAYGVRHGAIVVLDASPAQIEAQCSIVIRDAGLTELEPGTLTCGVRDDSKAAEA